MTGRSRVDGQVGARTGARTGPQADARRRAELRALARRLHPDLGGDPAAYLAAVEALDRAHRPPVPRLATSRRRRLARRAVRAARGLRERLPRRIPGSRRYASL